MSLKSMVVTENKKWRNVVIALFFLASRFQTEIPQKKTFNLFKMHSVSALLVFIHFLQQINLNMNRALTSNQTSILEFKNDSVYAYMVVQRATQLILIANANCYRNPLLEKIFLEWQTRNENGERGAEEEVL